MKPIRWRERGLGQKSAAAALYAVALGLVLVACEKKPMATAPVVRDDPSMSTTNAGDRSPSMRRLQRVPAVSPPTAKIFPPPARRTALDGRAPCSDVA